MDTAIVTRDRELDLGTLAPDFCLESQTGQEVCLSELLTRDIVVLYFYVRDRSPG